MARRKPGPAPKGGIRRPVRFPEEQLVIHEQAAQKLGLSFSEYIANLAARAAGLDEPYPAPNPQPALPLELQAA